MDILETISLRKVPGLERMNLTARDFEPHQHPTMLIWGLIFFAVAAAFAVLSFTVEVGGQPALVFQLLFLLFAGLGLLSVLSRFVHTPV